MLMGLRRNLRDARLQPLRQIAVGLMIAGEPSNVVDALQNDDVASTAARNHIRVDARHGVRSIAIQQNAIAADADIHHTQHAGLFRSWIGCQTRRQIIWPAMIFILRCVRAIRNGVAKCNHGGVSRCIHIDARNNIPGLALPGFAAQVRRTDLIAIRRVRNLVGVGMLRAGHGVIRKIHADGNVGQRRNIQRDWIADDFRIPEE